MLAILPLTVLLGSFIARAAADTSFITPGGSGSTGWKNNPSYEVDESMNVEWTTDLEETNLLLWQDYPSAGGGTQFFLQLRGARDSTSKHDQTNIVQKTQRRPASSGKSALTASPHESTKAKTPYSTSRSSSPERTTSSLTALPST